MKHSLSKHGSSRKVTELSERELFILHKELDLIQDVVNRMSKLSFFVKGWSISVLALGITVMAGIKGLSWLAALLFVPPLVAFWYLDAYYFQLEHAFRAKYKDVIDKRVACGDWSEPYRLNRRCYVEQWHSILRIMFGKDEFPFYAALLIVMVLVAIALRGL